MIGVTQSSTQVAVTRRARAKFGWVCGAASALLSLTAVASGWAAAAPAFTGPWPPPPPRNFSGSQCPPNQPSTPAPRMMTGNGTRKK